MGLTTQPEPFNSGNQWRFVWKEPTFELAIFLTDVVRTPNRWIAGRLQVLVNGRPLTAPSRFDLEGIRSRDEVSKRLWERTYALENGSRKYLLPMEEQDWKRVVDYVSGKVLEHIWVEAPIVELGLRPPDRTRTPYLVSPILIANQTNLLIGEDGTGKTYLADALAVAVATGLRLPNGWQATTTGPVLIIDAETDEETNNERIWAVSKGLGLKEPPRGIHYLRHPYPLPDDAAELCLRAKELGIVLVIADSLTQLVGGPLKDDGPAREFMNALKLFECTRLGIGHITKEDARNKSSIASPLGSVVFRADSRKVWEIARADEGKSAEIEDNLWETTYQLALHDRKRNNTRSRGEFGLLATFLSDNDDRTLSVNYRYLDPHESPALMQKATIGQRIVAVLKRRPLHEQEIADRIGEDEKSIKAECYRLEKRGTIERVRSQGAYHNKWTLVEK